MVAAQSVVAAGRTVADGPPAPLAARLLPAARAATTRRSASSCDRIRDGRTFTTRNVVAHQAGEAIFNLAASFARPEAGISHQDPAPEAPPPEALRGLGERCARACWAIRASSAQQRRRGAHRRRRYDLETPAAPEPRQTIWIRLRGTLPDDPLLHTALLVYMTRPHALVDRRAPARPAVGQAHDGEPRPRRLDPPPDPRCDSTLAALRQREPRRARRARHHLRRACSSDGVRIASVAQEALIRVRREG